MENHISEKKILPEKENSNKFGKVSRLQLVAALKNDRTILQDVSFTAPFKIMRPFYEKGSTMMVMQQTASAGIMAGDRQEIEICVKKGADMEVISQAYEKIHKMNEGYAERVTSIVMEPNTRLSYRPLPTIPFTGSDFRSRLRVELADETSEFIYQEVLCCGRVAHGEQFGYRNYQNQVSIYKKGHVVYFDNSRYVPQQMAMNSFGMYEGYTHMANLILCNLKREDAWLTDCRAYLDALESIDAAVTRMASGDIFIKIFGYSAEKLLKTMNDIMQR